MTDQLVTGETETGPGSGSQTPWGKPTTTGSMHGSQKYFGIVLAIDIGSLRRKCIIIVTQSRAFFFQFAFSFTSTLVLITFIKSKLLLSR